MKKKIFIFTIVLIVVCVVVLAVIILSTDRSIKKKPQEPAKPYPYYSEDVTFRNNEANVTLAGTLTLPSKDGNYPVVVLISGSGPQNRDCEMIGHKPFLVISDHLTRNGIAVLRYDDRGVGKSTGNFYEGTSLDFSTDVESAVSYLKTRAEIDTNKIGLIGHSDGGMIAPMVAARSGDVSFIVLLAGPGMQGAELLVHRQELMERALGMSETEMQRSKEHTKKMIEIITRSTDPQVLKADLTSFSKENYEDIPDYAVPSGMTKKQFVARHIDMLSTPWFQYFFTYDLIATLGKVKCPVLALNGDKDRQVPSKENLAGISETLKRGGNNNVTVKELPNLNHLFQECQTGMLDEYAKIEETFSPVALNEMTNWILKQVRDSEANK